MDANQVGDALRRKYSVDGWVFFRELRLTTGTVTGRILDAFAMNIYQSKGLHRVAFEIKVSRSDFLQEVVSHPEKRAHGMAVSNQFYYVVPVGLVRVDEVPEDCGLLEVSQDGQKVKRRKAAIHREHKDGVPSMFVAALMADLTREERKRPTMMLDGKALTPEEIEEEINRRVASEKRFFEAQRYSASKRTAEAEKQLSEVMNVLWAELPGVNVRDTEQLRLALQDRKPVLDSGTRYRLQSAIREIERLGETIKSIMDYYKKEAEDVKQG